MATPGPTTPPPARRNTSIEQRDHQHVQGGSLISADQHGVGRQSVTDQHKVDDARDSQTRGRVSSQGHPSNRHKRVRSSSSLDSDELERWHEALVEQQQQEEFPDPELDDVIEQLDRNPELELAIISPSKKRAAGAQGAVDSHGSYDERRREEESSSGDLFETYLEEANREMARLERDAGATTSLTSTTTTTTSTTTSTNTIQPAAAARSATSKPSLQNDSSLTLLKLIEDSRIYVSKLDEELDKLIADRKRVMNENEAKIKELRQRYHVIWEAQK
ncbi:hypothetical protein BZA70DRAFT_282835 [Myxozyma melibiosi]|uniref:Uncharacterized protein n=1 Tax=Myxozyma melibiosi TaxID=54550 RepID=A0ABR1F164_9ASCO